MALLAGEIADVRQEAMQAKTAARIVVEALREIDDLVSTFIAESNDWQGDDPPYALKAFHAMNNWQDKYAVLASLSRATEEK